MSTQPLNITQIRCSEGNATQLLTEVREKLSPSGDVVSEAGRKKTIEVFGEPLLPSQVVKKICHDVQTEGMDAVLRYSKSIDGADLNPETVRVSEAELEAAYSQVDDDFMNTVRRIRDRILKFQTAILHKDVQIEGREGGYLAQRYRPLERIGICVPGGAAAYPSTVLMTAVPALAAGVKELVVIAPPTKFGSYNQDLLATCHALGIKEVYRLGGAQGVAAMAYGAGNIVPVQKIVGPGNLFVALAKQAVYGTVDIDSIAGPSEVVIVAGSETSAEFAAADMIAQAEHSPGSSVFITWHEPLFSQITQELEKQLADADRGDLARTALEEFGAVILANDEQEAAKLANDFAPEHLHIATDNAEELLELIPHAGAAFLGPFSPVPVGDYVAGPSHVLPTSGTARWASGLCANDFLRPHSVISFSPEDLLENASDVENLANKEGLIAHWKAVEVRIEAAKTKVKDK